MRGRRVGAWWRWSPLGLAVGLVAVVVALAAVLAAGDVDLSDDVAVETTPREVQLRESALYDCLTTVPPEERLDRAFSTCGIEYERARGPDPGGEP